MIILSDIVQVCSYLYYRMDLHRHMRKDLLLFHCAEDIYNEHCGQGELEEKVLIVVSIDLHESCCHDEED